MTHDEAYAQFWKLETQRLTLQTQLNHSSVVYNKIPALAAELANVRQQQDRCARLLHAKRQTPDALNWAEIEEALKDIRTLQASFHERLVSIEGEELPPSLQPPSPEFTVKEVQAGDPEDDFTVAEVKERPVENSDE